MVALAGVASTAVPFLASWQPTQATRLGGLPVRIDLTRLADGEGITFLWRGTPIWVVRRGSDVVAKLRQQRDVLKDPDSTESVQPDFARNDLRSRRDDVLVLSALCTHLQCIPALKSAGDPELGNMLQNGFVCPCHGSRFDLAGRVFMGVPAPLNLPVPPYRYINDSTILIGSDTGNS